MDEKQKPPQIAVRLPDDIANGVFINMATVSHNETEFTMDLIYVQPQGPIGTIRARVITSPGCFKRMVTAFVENMRRYEEAHGVVNIVTVVPTVPNDGSVN